MKTRILKLLYIRQEKQSENQYGTWVKFRINPFNPLTWVVIILGLVIALLLFGLIGMWKEIDTGNRFKWHSYQISEKQVKPLEP